MELAFNPTTMSTNLVQCRRKLEVRGIVQGVGFRPFVHSLARKHGLTGFVGNDSSGVFIEIQGTPENLDAFVVDLEIASMLLVSQTAEVPGGF